MASPSDPSSDGGSPPTLLRRRRVLVTLIAGGVMAFVAISFIGFSGAVFTSTSRSPGNEYVAAGMGLRLSQSGQIVPGDGMIPGDVRTGLQTVTNTGHAGDLVLEAQDVDRRSALGTVLRLTVWQTAPALPDPVYDGTLDQLGTLALGTMIKDASRTFSFTVTWPREQDSPALSGETISLVFDWQLESVP